PKQVSSIARQFGRKWRLTETYGCTGWEFPLSGHKALGDWQAALGINLRCQHLSWYTMEGEAKRDYPAGIFYQSPWWEVYGKVEDYFARIHATMTRGEEVRDLLVVHPIESMWSICKKDWFKAGRTAQDINECDMSLVDLRDAILAENIDFDYGDEDILANHGKVGKKDDLPVLRVGRAVYKAVAVPPMLTMRKTTLELLKKFRESGGKVVFAGKTCGYLDGLPSKEIMKFARKCERARAKGETLPNAVDPLCRRVSIRDERGQEIVAALHLLREDRNAFYLFVCNAGHDFVKSKLGVIADLPVRDRTAVYRKVTIRGFKGCQGIPIELDPNTGEMFAADAKSMRYGWKISTSFDRIGSRMFIIPKEESSEPLPERQVLKVASRNEIEGGQWDIVLSECNNLLLDAPKFKIGDGEWQDAEEILKVDQRVRDAIGIQHRGGQMLQPWAWKNKKHPRKVAVELKYNFDVDTLPMGDIYVALEHPELFSVSVNGIAISMEAECGWWTDLSLCKVPFNAALLRFGTNEITISCKYDEFFSGLEAVYLLGTFGCEVNGSETKMTAFPTALEVGDWVPQGLPFYSGSVSYIRSVDAKLEDGERLLVEVPAYEGAAVRVLANGQVAGVIAWEPNEVDITDFVNGDSIDLRIEVIAHRRNSHGPLHLADKHPMHITPGHFTRSGAQWADDYQFVPCGLMEAPNLVVRK
ncbi:hypothetical protein ACFL1X_07835, partial [Candidatus Hydrogenedentota bacterium]